MKSLSFLLFFLWAFITLVGAATPKSIFILAGQSNMAGRGGLMPDPNKPNGTLIWDHSNIPPECMSNPSILRLAFNLTWVLAQEPLHVDIDKTKTCGIGPGMPFANELLKRDASLGVIGLVPCAIGGTSIAEWIPGTTLYNQMMKRAAAALQGGGQIRALLWYQGENDADTDSDHSFAGDVERFFKSVRKDLRIPDLPIIQVALPSTVKGKYIKEIRKSQLELKLPALTTVDADGSELQFDKLHLTTNAQLHLGIMMANAFLQMSHH